MSKRVCPTPGCPNLTTRGKCASCKAKAEQARGSSTARGYDYTHQQQRRQWAPAVAAGKVHCGRCGDPIKAGAEWDLGHDPTRRHTHPEHRACNRATAAHRTER